MILWSLGFKGGIWDFLVRSVLMLLNLILCLMIGRVNDWRIVLLIFVVLWLVLGVVWGCVWCW